MRKIKTKEVSGKFDALVSNNAEQVKRKSVMTDDGVQEYYQISIDKLLPYEKQARKKFDDEAITNLAETIKEYGVRQPLTVSRADEVGFYKVISGERRLRASKEAGLNKVPCIVLKEDNRKEEIALIENLHRIDLHPVEIGEAYHSCLLADSTLNQQRLSDKLGVAKSVMSERINLANLPDRIKDKLIEDNILSRPILRKLLGAQSEEEMKSILGMVERKRTASKNIFRIYTKDGKVKIHFYKHTMSDLQKSEAINKLREVIKELED